MIRITHISDTHCRDIPSIVKGFESDVLLITGDMSFTGNLNEMSQFKADLKEIRKDFTRIAFCCGNHERDLWKYPGICEEIAADTNTDYLLDSSVVIEGIKIWGSPYTPKFFNWGFMYDRPTNRWNMIPDDAKIIMTHGPAKDVLDKCPDGFNAGCEDLKKRLQQIRSVYHLSGHIHMGFGHLYDEAYDIHYYNSSICDEMYYPTNKPQVFEI